MERRGDRIFAVVLAVAAAALLVTARADGRSRWTATPMPVGWHEVHRPLTDVTLPVQVFAAATYPLVLHHPPGRCGPPPAILAEMPRGGALLQVIEYPPWDENGRPIRVPRLPRRPDRFTWADATWARYECSGPSDQLTYRQAGRALQAQIWMNPATVAPRARAGALRILDRLQVESASAGSGGGA